MTAATTVWQSEVKYFSKIRRGPYARGLLEFTPKKLVREKIVANLARHLLATSQEIPDHLLLFAPNERLHSALLKQLLPEIYHLEICADDDDDMLALFGQPDGSYISVSLCANAQKFSPNLQDIAKSLHMFIPELAPAANALLAQRLDMLEQTHAKLPTAFRSLVMQDENSKFLSPELETLSLRSAARLLKSAAQNKQAPNSKTMLEAPMGSGFYTTAFEITKSPPSSPKHLRAAAKRLRLSTQTHSFDSLPLVVFAAMQWLEECTRLKPEQLHSLKILTPYASVALQILRLFEQEAKTTIDPQRIDIDQFIFGWQKNLPLMQMLDPDNAGPGLLIQIDQFPTIDLFLVWQE